MNLHKYNDSPTSIFYAVGLLPIAVSEDESSSERDLHHNFNGAANKEHYY